jgi:hypothetical protein
MRDQFKIGCPWKISTDKPSVISNVTFSPSVIRITETGLNTKSFGDLALLSIAQRVHFAKEAGKLFVTFDRKTIPYNDIHR